MKIRAEAARAMEQMFAAASKANIKLTLVSGYRSYAEQSSLYQTYVNRSGVVSADAYSAHAGHSEHQTGWAADLEPLSGKCELDRCFGDMLEGKWLADNAPSFGFIIRYQKGNEKLTGYEYEPWHIRYVGNELAQQIKKTGYTLEQFFGLPAVTTYPASSYQLSPGA